MELVTTLKAQTVQNQIRQVGINPNHWYPVAWSHQLKSAHTLPVMVWKQPIVLYREASGRIYAMDNACPHKGVELHQGDVQGDRLICPYHGWAFNPEGQCVNIPYFPEGQKLPCANVKTYPAEERYGILWVFPGDPELSTLRTIPEIPEYDDPNWLAVPITGHFKAHFSICNENTMDVFHGYLHQNLQGWFNPTLLKLKETDASVCADYRVSYRGALSKFLGLSTDGDGITTRTVSVHYNYPHYHSTLEGVSSLYLMRLPVGPEETRSFSIMFLQLRLPKWLLNPLKKFAVPLIRDLLFMRFLEQDVEMMESEQRNYRINSDRRYVEINPAIIALQRLIVRQYEQFMQQSSQLQNHRYENAAKPVSLSSVKSSGTEEQVVEPSSW